MKDDEKLMHEAIKLRLESDTWNYNVAANVISIKNLKKENSLFRGYVTSLAAAAVFMIIFIFNIYSYINSNSTGQPNSALYSYSSTNDTLNTEETDLLINEVFPMR